jgi:hypothetical protein
MMKNGFFAVPEPSANAFQMCSTVMSAKIIPVVMRYAFIIVLESRHPKNKNGAAWAFAHAGRMIVCRQWLPDRRPIVAQASPPASSGTRNGVAFIAAAAASCPANRLCSRGR